MACYLVTYDINSPDGDNTPEDISKTNKRRDTLHDHLVASGWQEISRSSYVRRFDANNLSESIFAELLPLINKDTDSLFVFELHGFWGWMPDTARLQLVADCIEK